MEQRCLGKDGPSIPVLGFGAWAIGGPWEYGWGPQDDHDSQRTIRRALDLGLLLVDTADVYGLGHSEELLGQALQGERHRVFLATKAGMQWDASGKTARNSQPGYLLRALEASLRRLRTDYIDLYQIHWPDPHTPVEATAGALDQMVRSGKVRWVGVSNFSVPEMEAFLRVRPLNALQLRYNLIEREAEEELLPFCLDHGIGVLAYAPLAHGLLTGKFTEQRILAPDDHRRRKKQFKPENLSRNLQIVARLKPVAESLGKTVLQLALAWVLHNPAVTAALVGARHPGQLDETVGAAGWEIPADQLAQIDKILSNSA